MFTEDFSVFFNVLDFGISVEYYTDINTKYADIVVMQDIADEVFSLSDRDVRATELRYLVPFQSYFTQNQFLKVDGSFYKIKFIDRMDDGVLCTLHLVDA
jgi:hypothetical protein